MQIIISNRFNLRFFSWWHRFWLKLVKHCLMWFVKNRESLILKDATIEIDKIEIHIDTGFRCHYRNCLAAPHTEELHTKLKKILHFYTEHDVRSTWTTCLCFDFESNSLEFTALPCHTSWIRSFFLGHKETSNLYERTDGKLCVF